MIPIDDKTRSIAMLISSVLMRSFLIGAGVLILSSIPVLLMTDQIYSIHNGMIEIPRPEYNALLFAWLGNFKLVIVGLFLLPAIAIRWALKAA